MKANSSDKPKHAHQSELIAEFDQLLGKSIRTFQELEMFVGHRMLQLASSSSMPAGDLSLFTNVAIAELSFGAKLRLLGSLLTQQIPKRSEFKLCQEDPAKWDLLNTELERASKSIRLLSSVEEQRNRYVHSYWLVLGQPPSSADLTPVVRMKTRANPKKSAIEAEEFSAQIFRNFIDETGSAGNELSQSTGRLLGLLNYDEDKKRRRESDPS